MVGGGVWEVYETERFGREAGLEWRGAERRERVDMVEEGRPTTDRGREEVKREVVEVIDGFVGR